MVSLYCLLLQIHEATAVNVYSFDSACSVLWLNRLSGTVNVCLTDAFTHWPVLIYSSQFILYNQSTT